MIFNLSTILEILGFGGYIVGGIFGLSGFFDTGAKTRRQENDRITNDLIQNQGKKIEEMQKTLEEATKTRDAQIGQLREDVAHLSGRNSVLEDLFKGRDPQQSAFFKDSPILFAIAKENNEMAKKNFEAMTHLMQSIDTLVSKITTRDNIESLPE